VCLAITGRFLLHNNSLSKTKLSYDFVIKVRSLVFIFILNYSRENLVHECMSHTSLSTQEHVTAWQGRSSRLEILHGIFYLETICYWHVILWLNNKVFNFNVMSDVSTPPNPWIPYLYVCCINLVICLCGFLLQTCLIFFDLLIGVCYSWKFSARKGQTNCPIGIDQT